MAKDPVAVATKWSRNLAGATQSITDGVNSVTQAPGAKAAAQVTVWLSRLQAAQDKWVRNTSAVTLQQWQNAMITKGIPRIASGATAAIPKMTQFMQQWLPFVDAGAQQVRAMPNATIEDGILRAVAQIRYNATFIRKPYIGG